MLQAEFEHRGSIGLQIHWTDTTRDAREDEVRRQQREKQVAAGTWVEIYDADTKTYYYRHTVTGEVTYNRPDDYILAAEDMTLLFSTIRIQSKFRLRSLCRKVRTSSMAL